MTSLTACSTIEIAHVPIKCLGQPEASLNFTEKEAQRFKLTDEEAESMGLTRAEADAFESDMKLKVREFAVTLRQRIISQCNLNKHHDEKHKN